MRIIFKTGMTLNDEIINFLQQMHKAGVYIGPYQDGVVVKAPQAILGDKSQKLLEKLIRVYLAKLAQEAGDIEAVKKIPIVFKVKQDGPSIAETQRHFMN